MQNDTAAHVLRYSCGNCAHLEDRGGSHQGCNLYVACKAGKPLSATPSCFSPRQP